jgi:hypothetical protein
LRFLNARRGPLCGTFCVGLHFVVAGSGPALLMFVDEDDEEDGVTGDEHID